MKSYKDITLRYAKKQKKRTVLTLVGIILSVALITALSTLMFSLVENMRLDVIKNNGDHHLSLNGISLEDTYPITQRAGLKRYGYAQSVGVGQIGEYNPQQQEYF